MNSLLVWIWSLMVSFDFNVSDFVENWTRYAFNPYTSLFGNVTWAIIFGFFGAGIYVGSKSTITIFTYLTVVGLIFALILPAALTAIFVLILTFIGTIALYIVYVTRKGQ